MILELHIASDRLLRQLRNGLAKARCNDKLITVNGEPRYLDHVEVEGDGQLQATFAASGPPDILILQKVRMYFASFSELKGAGHHGTSLAAGVRADVTLTFRLSVSTTPNGAQLTLSYVSLDAPSLDATTRVELGFALVADMGDQSWQISLSPLSRLIYDTDVTRAELSVPAGKTSPLALRMSVNSQEPTLFDSQIFWVPFEQGVLFDTPFHDWAVVLDGQAVVDIVVNVLNQSLKEKIADGAFTLESGPSGLWVNDKAEVSLHGSINDACEILWWQIDMGTEITATLKPSCPAPNVVRFDFALDMDDNKLAIFVCSAAFTFQFWFSAIKLLDEGELKPGQYAAGLLFEFAGLPQLIFGLTWDTLSSPPIADQIPSESQGIPLTKVPNTSHDVEVQGDMPMNLGSVGSLGPMVIEHVGGSAVGPVFSGSLPAATPLEQADMHVERTPWRWSLVDPCSTSAGYQLTASIHYGAQDAAAQPIGVCSVMVLTTAPDSDEDLDPAGQFAAAKLTQTQGAQEVVLTLSEDQVTGAYIDAPYDCLVWLDTDAGKRVVDLGPFPALTAELKAKLDVGALQPACTGADSAVLWGGDWNPVWSVDPGPLDWGELTRLWRFAVTTLPAGDQVAMRVGETEIGVGSELAGRAHLTHLSAPEDPALALRRVGKAGKLPKGARVVTMQQALLASLGMVRTPTADLQGFAALRAGERTWLAMACHDRVDLYDLSYPARATPAGALPASGVRGVRAHGAALYTFGAQGVAEWRWSAGRWQAGQSIRGAAADVAVSGSRVAVIEDERVVLYDTHLRRLGVLDAPRALGVVLDPGAAHVLTADAISRHDVASLAAGHRLALPAPARIDRIVDDGRPGALAVTLADGETWVVAPDAQRELHRVESYRATPWFAGAQRVGELLFRPARHGGGVMIDRIVARGTFQR
jgi:hypothetical protein